MPESPGLNLQAPDQPEDELKKLEEIQKAQDQEFMKGYQDISMDDLISKGYVVHTINVANGFIVKMRTLKKKEELEIKQRISQYDGTQIYVLDQINLDTLVHAVMEINGVPLPTEVSKKSDNEISIFEARKNVLQELGDIICLSLIEEYRGLNKALVILLKGSSKNSLARLLLGREPV